MTRISDVTGVQYLPWMEQGSCVTLDPEVWYPSMEQGDGPHTIEANRRAAKRICSSCEVRDQCFDYAVANGERFGIWGGEEFDGAVDRRARNR